MKIITQLKTYKRRLTSGQSGAVELLLAERTLTICYTLSSDSPYQTSTLSGERCSKCSSQFPTLIEDWSAKMENLFQANLFLALTHIRITF
jgi:hypothetical protein